MRLQVKGRNLEVSDAIRSYAEQKLSKLERQLGDGARVDLELMLERNPSISSNHVAEATVWTKGPVLRAKESSHDMKASIDLLVDKLERQAQRLREKRRRGHGRHGGDTAAAASPEPGGPVVVKTKQFAIKPMTPEEATLQMELLGHDFFLFTNADTSASAVVYRRNDGDIGLIEGA